MITYNGTRNFELASKLIYSILTDNKPTQGPSYLVHFYRDNLMPIDRTKYPYINIITELVEPVSLDGVNTTNDVVIGIYIGTRCDTEGGANSMHSKDQLMELIGWVNNMIVKYDNFYPGGNIRQVCNIKPGSIKFSGVQQWDTDGTTVGVHELTLKITENNENTFTERLREVFTRVDGYDWNYVQL